MLFSSAFLGPFFVDCFSFVVTNGFGFGEENAGFAADARMALARSLTSGSEVSGTAVIVTKRFELFRNVVESIFFYLWIFEIFDCCFGYLLA